MVAERYGLVLNQLHRLAGSRKTMRCLKAVKGEARRWHRPTLLHLAASSVKNCCPCAGQVGLAYLRLRLRILWATCALGPKGGQTVQVAFAASGTDRPRVSDETHALNVPFFTARLNLHPLH